MNNNQYPVNLRQVMDILSNHKHDNYKTRKERTRAKDDKDETTKTSEASFAQSNNTKTCYCCDKKGHMSPKCPEKDKIPREDWVIHKAEQHMQAWQKKDDDDTSQSSKSSKKTGWSGMQVCLMDKQKDISSKMKDDIILDNGSTLSIFVNPELVKEIRKSKSTLEMATNKLTYQVLEPYGTLKEQSQTLSVPQNWWRNIELHSTQVWKTCFWYTNRTRS